MKGENMSKNKNFPNFDNYENASEWLDTHSTADLESTVVNFEVASPLQLIIVDSLTDVEESIVIDTKLSKEIYKIAKKEKISVNDLINKWVKEKLNDELKKSSEI